MTIELTRGERFKDARTIRNQHGKQTMDEVTAATGIPKSKISALEDDETDRGVDYREVGKLAKHYGVSADWLIGISEHSSFKEDVQAASSYTGLDNGSIEALHRIKEHGSNVERYTISFLNRELQRKKGYPIFSEMELYVISTHIKQTLPEECFSEEVKVQYDDVIWKNSVGSLLRGVIIREIQERLESLRKSTGERDINDFFDMYFEEAANGEHTEG